MRRLCSRFLSDQSGATAIEYCLIAVGISIVIIAAVNGIAPPQHRFHFGEFVAEIAAGQQRAPCKSFCLGPGARKS